jgi:hypothetical protein
MTSVARRPRTPMIGQPLRVARDDDALAMHAHGHARKERLADG